MNHFKAISQCWDTGVLQFSLPKRVVNEKRKTWTEGEKSTRKGEGYEGVYNNGQAELSLRFLAKYGGREDQGVWGGVDGETVTAVWGLCCVHSLTGSALLIFRHEAGILSRVLLCSAVPAKLFLVSLLQLHNSLWQIDWHCLFTNRTANWNVTTSKDWVTLLLTTVSLFILLLQLQKSELKTQFFIFLWHAS